MRMNMLEYTDYCPNCGQVLYVEEDRTECIIKTRPGLKGKVVTECPQCEMSLEIVNGNLSVVQE